MYTLRKTSVLTVGLALVLALLIGAFTLLGDKSASAGNDPTDPGAASGDKITPTLIQGNPDCSNISGGPYRELKIDDVNGPFDGPYTSGDGLLTVTISDSTSQSFKWSSNIGVDAVIVKGGPAGDAYVYDPPKEDTGDTGLHPPVDPNNGEYYGISHVSFCYDLELQVSKTADTSLKRTHTWTIDKTADKDEETLPVGGTSPVNYSVTVDQTSQDSDWKVDGTITVTAPIAATVTSVTDVISGGINATVDCGENSLPAALSAGESLTCDYSANLTDATTRTNTATATSGTPGVKDGTGTAPVNFANATVEEIDEQIDVEDSLQGNLGTANAADAPETFNYTRNVGPYEQCGNYEVPNTASFVTVDDDNDTDANGQSSWNVDVTVLCNVKVEKTVSGAKPSGSQAFTFQLRQGASTTEDGTILESKVANAANGGVINFTSGLQPGSTYQLCEIVMPGWSTSLGQFVPGSFMPPDGIAPDPTVDNSILCVNFTAQPGQTFKVDNTPPPGGRALTIGFWKNWASCSGGGQKPVLDQTLAKAEPTGVVISATSGTYAPFGSTFYLVLHGSTTKPNSAPDCLKAVRLLNKSSIDKGKKLASDPAFNLAAQLLAAELNYTAGAGKTPTATSAINQAVLLLGKYKFDGSEVGGTYTGGTHTPISAADATTMNNLAKTLDDYNNNR
jgi:hypothetical protein